MGTIRRDGESVRGGNRYMNSPWGKCERCNNDTFVKIGREDDRYRHYDRSGGKRDPIWVCLECVMMSEEPNKFKEEIEI